MNKGTSTNHPVLHLDMKNSHITPSPKQTRESIYKNSIHLFPKAQCRCISAVGGCTTVAEALYIQSGQKARLGVMVAGNSGRPGGDVGTTNGVQKVHTNHKTQEEDIVSNWLITESNGSSSERDSLYNDTIYNVWGMCTPKGSTDIKTIQGVDYVNTTNPTKYADAWVVKNAYLSPKMNETGRWTFDVNRKFPASLVFVAGPNAGAGRSKYGSTKRTLNSLAMRDDDKGYTFFKEGVKEAIRTGLDAMAADGVDIALIAKVSCGIYAGPHKKKINMEFTDVIDEVLGERVCNSHTRSHTRGEYFQDVIVPGLQHSSQRRGSMHHTVHTQQQRMSTSARPSMWYVDPVHGVQPTAYAFHVGFEYRAQNGFFYQVPPNTPPFYMSKGQLMRAIGSNMTQIAGAADVTSAYTGHGLSNEEQMRRAIAASTK